MAAGAPEEGAAAAVCSGCALKFSVSSARRICAFVGGCFVLFPAFAAAVVNFNLIAL
jgi:hypothetical protein